MSTTVGDVYLAARVDDSKLETEMVQAGSQAGGKAGDAAGKTMGARIGDSLKKHSTLIATTAGATVGTFLAGSAQEFGQFQNSMNEVFTLLPGISEEAMSKMEGQVKDFSNEFGKLPDEVVPALYQSLSAGVPQDNVFAFLETANKLAVGGVADTSAAVGVLAAITKGYGDTSEEATQQVSDMLFTTVKLGTTTIPELAASLGKAVPQAAALNVAQSELFATTAALTGVTGNTAEVATQMKAIFTALLNPTAQMKEGLKALGYESGQAAIEQLGLQGTLQALEGTTGGNTEQFAKMLGSSEALTAGLAVVGNRADAVAENMVAMQDAAGATDAAFEQMDSGVTGVANRIKAKIKTLSIDIGGILEPVAPLFMAFGPTIGKALGGAFGAGFGYLTTLLPKLMAPVLAKIVSLTAGTQFGTNLVSAMNTEGMLSKLKTLGGGWGKVIGIGAAAAMGVIILQELQELNKLAGENATQAQAIDASTQKLLSEGVTRQQAEETLANLKAIRDESEGVKGAILEVGKVGEGNVLGSVFDIAFGDNPAETVNKQIDEFERFLAYMDSSGADGAEAAARKVGEGYVAGMKFDAQAANAAAKGGKMAGMNAAQGVKEGVSEGLDGYDPLSSVAFDPARVGKASDAKVTGAMLWDRFGMGEAVGELPGLLAEAMARLDAGWDVSEAFQDLPAELQDTFALAAHGVDFKTAFADVPKEVSDALRPMWDVVKDEVRSANRQAKFEAAGMGPSLRDGIKQGKDVVKAAMADLAWTMTHPLKGVKAIAQVEGALTSKRLRQGLKSDNPLVKREAQRTKQLLIEQWQQLTGESWDYGESTVDNLAGGITKRQNRAKRAARQARKAATDEIAGAPAEAQESGEKTSKSFAQGIWDYIGKVTAAAIALAQEVADPTKPGSPTKTGPLSQDGGIEGWGQRLATQFGAGLGKGNLDISKSLGLSSLEGVGARLATGRVPTHEAGGGGGNTTVNVDTWGLPMRAETPQEVSQQIRRVARFGGIVPTREAHFKRTTP